MTNEPTTKLNEKMETKEYDGLPFYSIAINFWEAEFPYIATGLYYNEALEVIEKFFKPTNDTFKNAKIWLNEKGQEAFVVREINQPYL